MTTETYLFSDHEGITGEEYRPPGYPIECESCGASVCVGVEIRGATVIGDLLNLDEDVEPDVEYPCPEIVHVCDECVEHLVAAKEEL